MIHLDILKILSIKSWLKQYNYDLEVAFNAYFKDQLDNPSYAGKEAEIDTELDQFIIVALAWKPHKIIWPPSQTPHSPAILEAVEKAKILLNNNGDVP